MLVLEESVSSVLLTNICYVRQITDIGDGHSSLL